MSENKTPKQPRLIQTPDGTNYTDTQLLRMFPVLLPEEVEWKELKATAVGTSGSYCYLYNKREVREVKPTEYLDLCRRIEEKLTQDEKEKYARMLTPIVKLEHIPIKYWPTHYVSISMAGSWQQRLIALCEVLGKEIPKV